MNLKISIKNLIKKLPFRFTKNQQYDYYTRKIIKLVCKQNSNCVDIGCHKGEILDIFITHAPLGNHYGFEPLPDLYEQLKIKYENTNHQFYDVALSNQMGEASFNYVITNPAYSGLKKRNYDHKNEKDTTIKVQVNTLDNVINENLKIDFIKIDVEGAELLVLEGAIKLLERNKPFILFEHGLGASEIYNSYPDKIFDFFEKLNMKISLLPDFVASKKPLSKVLFEQQFYKKINYYFIAHI